MEIEYFFNPKASWEDLFEEWLTLQEQFARSLGAKEKDLRRYEHPKEKLSHYSRKTIDIEYQFPFGFKELFGLAHRFDFDLTQHTKHSGKTLDYFDNATNERYVPHALEPTFGLDRSVLVALCSAYAEEKLENGEERVVLKLPPYLAPVKVAVFPLVKNKPELVGVARDIFQSLRSEFVCEFDDHGNVGKRYRRQDEIGTPFCVTVDYESLSSHTVTVRNRDSMQQERVSIDSLRSYLHPLLQTTL